MEAAAKNNSPVMIQASNGGAQFVAGKSIKDKNACAAGSVALALHVRAMAPYYGVPVIMHSDHCAKNLLPWFDGMLEADEAYFAQFGEPLFSSHMLDLSEEPDEENIAICVQYFKRMGKSFSELGLSFVHFCRGRGSLTQDAIPLYFFLCSTHEALAGDGNRYHRRRRGWSRQ